MAKRKPKWHEKLETDTRERERLAALGCFVVLLAALIWIAAFIGAAAFWLDEPAQTGEP